MGKTLKTKRSIVILNEKGLHTRPATELVKYTQAYASEIYLIYRGLRVSAKSLLGILMLAATRGAEIEIEASGIDAEEAVEMIITLARNEFNIQY